MTVGDNIRRIRKMRGLTQKELGARLGVSEAFIRAYESGRRNPKEKNLQAIADALVVNIEVLRNSDIDGIKAMHMLFQIARQYSGNLSSVEDEDGNIDIKIDFTGLPLLVPWQMRYEEYLEEVAKADLIKDVKERVIALNKARNSYDMWMDTFPDSGVSPEMLNLQKSMDSVADRHNRDDLDTE